MTTEIRAPFVKSGAGTLRAALVVPPAAALARVAPAHGESSPIVERAGEQFVVFGKRLAALGVIATSLVTPDGPLGSLCVDAALVFPDGAFLMRPSDLARRGEIAAVEVALVRAGVPIVGRIDAPGLLDGGDAFVAGGTLFVAVPRSRRSELGIPPSRHGNRLGREQLAAYARLAGLAVVEVPLNEDVLRLRAVASALDDETILCAPGVLDVAAFAGFKTIEVPRGEDYAAGVLTLGPRRAIANLRFRQTLPRLRKAKIAVDAIDLWEFGKVGITPSLLALAIARD